MRWQQTEFILKGAYLGLLVLVGMQAPDWMQAAQVALFAVGGLIVSLGVIAVRMIRDGYRVRGRFLGFILFLILENPVLVYTGLIVGLAAGTYTILRQNDLGQNGVAVMGPVLGGAALGYVFWLLRHVRDRRISQWVGLALAIALAGGAITFLIFEPIRLSGQQRDMIGYLLLLGIPGFYLLTFAGTVEESEIEIGAVCAALGIGLWIIGDHVSPTFKNMALLVPLTLYFVYTRRIMPGLRVFKHVLRGLSYAKVGRNRQALVALGRAIELDADNPLAQETLWRVHQDMDYDQLANDPETLAVVNFQLCLDRAAFLLCQGTPSAEQLHEAERLLDFIEGQKPHLWPRCSHWRAVALTHRKDFDRASEELRKVLLPPETDSTQRRAMLFQSWQLALLLHPEIKKRVGEPLLTIPGRRMEAIAGVERRLAQQPDDQAAWELKRLLYSELTEDEYRTSAGRELTANDFNHEYAQQLGLALLEDKDRWQRGCAFLRIAAAGLPAKAPALFIQIGKAHEKANDPAGLWENLELARQAGKAVGPANLADEDRHALFAAVKHLGDHAITIDNVDHALECFKFYSQHEKAAKETWRTLAELFERKHKLHPEEGEEPLWMALNCTEHGLSYDSSDKDLVSRKDRYYFSITPPELKKRLDNVYKWFDVEYCKQKARFALEKGNGDLELLEWASHLVELAQVYEPAGLSARVLRARVLRVRGESDQAIGLLEEVRAKKPEKFVTDEEEEAWFLAHRMLGELYVDEKPDQAILCFQEFRKSPRSGANTMYNLGRAYENLGDRPRAIHFYEQVMAFEGNPLSYDARDAIDRLKGASGSFS